MDIKNWKEEFNEKFTYGGRVGVVALKTDNAHDIKDFIDQLLQERDKEFLQDLELARKACSYQPVSIASEMICNLYNKYSPQEDKQ